MSNCPRSVSRYSPLLENSRLLITTLTLSVCRAAPVAESQSRTVLSSEADATSLPSGEKATALTSSKWPSSVCSAAPVAKSQSRTVLSRENMPPEADATSLPSGEKATVLTPFEWPSSVCRAAPVAES